MILKRKVICISVSLAVICLIAFFGSNIEKSVSVSSDFIQKPQIIIDAGHGGFDGGAVADDGTVEKNINLKISDALSKMLMVSGYEVIRTRTSDNSTEDNNGEKIASRKKSDLKNRLELMKKYPDGIFVSIHLNKFTTSSAKGSQVF
ncbi:MAG: N-acetylmuramoyl-L-alanine amidase, partial [Clostridia bacterium]|nr:N-acetylmuramoyl-L-alanine amidase [Clostridia bacterium]